MSGVMIGVGVVAIGAGIYSSVQAGKSADEANRIAEANMEEQNRIARENLRFQREQQAKLDKQKAEYRKFEFTNPGCKQLQDILVLVLPLKAYVNMILSNLDLQ